MGRHNISIMEETIKEGGDVLHCAVGRYLSGVTVSEVEPLAGVPTETQQVSGGNAAVRHPVERSPDTTGPNLNLDTAGRWHLLTILQLLTTLSRR